MLWVSVRRECVCVVVVVVCVCVYVGGGGWGVIVNIIFIVTYARHQQLLFPLKYDGYTQVRYWGI